MGLTQGIYNKHKFGRLKNVVFRVPADKDDAWDAPYRWRELVSSNEINVDESEDTLINLPYNRDPELPLAKLSKSEETVPQNIKPIQIKNTSKYAKNVENKAVQKKSEEKSEFTRINLRKTLQRDDDQEITRPANQDFDYIRPSPVSNRPKSADPVAELKKMSRKNNESNEDDPPFNFQAMLRKTNYNKEINQNTEVIRTYSLKKTGKLSENEKALNGMNMEIANETIGTNIKTELAPGIFLEGIEVDL